VVVLGAETDVCVLQTVLGLRALGFTVLLQSDAVFTEETNTPPAFRRMQQAGAVLVDLAAVNAFAADPSTLPAAVDVAVAITRPLELGVVLNAFTDAALAANDDPLTTQKSARLRELLLVSEWFSLPVYADAPLPSQYAQYYQGTLRPLAQIDTDANVEQLVFAGTDGGLATALAVHASSHEIFLMEDALLGQTITDTAIVPTTYKAFYYDMTKSVDLGQWPSQEWVQKFDEYYWITQAPEDLPSMPPQ
jgi:hypothetical protein